MKLGFIGFGNMAQAIVKGLLLKKVCDAQDIFVCAKKFRPLRDRAEQFGVNAMSAPLLIVRECDVIVLAVPPANIEEVILPIKDLLKGKLVISIAWGWTFDRFQKILQDETVNLICTLPNTPVRVAEGIFICEEQHSLTEELLEQFKNLIEPIARLEFVATKSFMVAGSLAACAPAFTAMYIEALADACVKYGLARANAYQVAAQMIRGTGALYLDMARDKMVTPANIKDAICTPGGSTIRGVTSLEKNRFRGAIISAVDEIIE